MTSRTALAAALAALAGCAPGGWGWRSPRPAEAPDLAGGGWRGHGGVAVEAVRFDGRQCLHVAGTQPAGWTYAAGPPISLRPGGKYRLSAQLRVGRVTPPQCPHVRIEFLARDANGTWRWPREIGRARTNRYDLARGGWQELSVEFVCPPQAAGGWVALQKGTDAPRAVEAWLADVRVAAIDELAAARELRFRPVPAALAAAAARREHPRLYLTPARLAALREQVAREPLRSLLAKVRAVADAGAAAPPPRYPDKETDDQQLWQKPVGNMIPHLAVCYLLTGEAKYLAAATAWMLASAGYPTWGLGKIDGTDLAASHQLFGLAVGYDWLHGALDEPARSAVRRCLARRGQFLYERLLNQEVWWHDAYLQNHLWINTAALAAAGLALYGEQGTGGVPAELDGWITLPLAKFRTSLEWLGGDGACHEGLPYWSYSLEHMLKFTDLARDLLGEDLPARSRWLAETASFCLHSQLPPKHWRAGDYCMTFADGAHACWYGPDYILRRLAGLYGDGRAQWLAEQLDRAGLCAGEASWLNLLWHDAAVAPAAPWGTAAGAVPLPTLKHFADLDVAFVRDAWDGGEVLLGFKCGPPVGHEALRRCLCDPGGGHVHPDAGAIQLFAYGDWLLADDGYALKTTAWQNTVLVNGVGQIGDGGPWLEADPFFVTKRATRIVLARPGRRQDYLVGDAAAAYKPRAALRTFRRHVLYLKPDAWVIADELAAETPSTFELLLHSELPVAAAGGAWQVTGPRGKLRITPLLPAGAAAKTIVQEIRRTGGEAGGKLNCLVLSNPARQKAELFVTVLEARPAGADFADRPHVAAGEGRVVRVHAGGGWWRVELLGGPGSREPLLLKCEAD